MSEHDQTESETKASHRRKRKRVLRIVEEVFSHGKWVTKGEGESKAKKRRYKISGLHEAGRRVRKFFATRTEAQTFLDQQMVRIENLGTRVHNVPGPLLEDAAECEDLLAKYGIRLIDAVRGFLEARAHLEGFPGVSVAEAAKWHAQTLSDRQKSWTIEEAVTAWLESRKRKGASDRYLGDARARAGRFIKAFEGANLADIDPSAVEDWVHGLGLSAQSIKNYLTVLGSLFSYALKQGRSPRNPIKSVEKPQVTRKEPVIWTPSTLRTFLSHLPSDTIPYVVISAFAGLRPVEVRSLRWEDINLKTGLISVPYAIAKTKRRRTVPISPNLKAWLESHAKESGLVVPLAEVTLRIKRLNPVMKKMGIKWPQDGLRHSAASYWLVKQEGNDALVASWLGHDVTVLHQHYKALFRDPADAEEWFSIMPEAVQVPENVIPIKVA